MRWIVIAAVLLGGCEDRAKGDAATTRCDGERARLEQLGDPPRVRRLPDGVPVIEGATPVPDADRELLRKAFDFRAGGQDHWKGEPPSPEMLAQLLGPNETFTPDPLHYLVAEAAVPVAALYLDRQLGIAREVRLVVRLDPDVIMAAYAPRDPGMPATLRPRLATMSTAQVDDELRARTQGCDFGAVLDAIGPEGGTRFTGTIASETLRHCKCQVDDVATVVSLVLWASTPRPHAGYLTIRRDVVDALPPDATVGDLAAALAK